MVKRPLSASIQIGGVTGDGMTNHPTSGCFYSQNPAQASQQVHALGHILAGPSTTATKVRFHWNKANNVLTFFTADGIWHDETRHITDTRAVGWLRDYCDLIWDQVQLCEGLVLMGLQTTFNLM